MNPEANAGYPVMLAALSQPTRLKIVEVVASAGDDGTAAGDIARAVHCPASTLSFHLKELTQAGMLESKPQGRFIRYRLRPDAFASLGRFVAALPGIRAEHKPPRRKGGKRRHEATEGLAGTEGQLSIFED